MASVKGLFLHGCVIKFPSCFVEKRDGYDVFGWVEEDEQCGVLGFRLWKHRCYNVVTCGELNWIGVLVLFVCRVAFGLA